MAPQLWQEKNTEMRGKLIIGRALLPEWAKAQPAFSSPVEAKGGAVMHEAYADPTGGDRPTIEKPGEHPA